LKRSNRGRESKRTHQDLQDHLRRIPLRELPPTRDLLKQFPAARELEDEVELLARFEVVVELDCVCREGEEGRREVCAVDRVEGEKGEEIAEGEEIY
jgi:hypothetical protein